MQKCLTLFRDMPIGMKVGAITCLLFIPIVSLLYSFLSTRQEAIAFAHKELLGIEYLASLKNLYEHMPQHRGLVAMHLGGQVEQRIVFSVSRQPLTPISRHSKPLIRNWGRRSIPPRSCKRSPGTGKR